MSRTEDECLRKVLIARPTNDCGKNWGVFLVVRQAPHEEMTDHEK
jgi:hypothetical protein